MQKFYWTCGSGYVELLLTAEQAELGHHQGQCDADVAALVKDPSIAAQVATWDRAKLALTLKEYGAWNDAELADHEQNIQRMVWIACGDVIDDPDNHKEN